MSNCEPQDPPVVIYGNQVLHAAIRWSPEPQDPPVVNYGYQVLQAAIRWSPVPPQAQSRVHVH